MQRAIMTKSITLEAYYGVSSPWAYLGHPTLLRIARENGLTIHLKPITVILENGGLPVCANADQARIALAELSVGYPVRRI
jgi:2-hydroxychromene-2-carboxylate isomerase